MDLTECSDSKNFEHCHFGLKRGFLTRFPTWFPNVPVPTIKKLQAVQRQPVGGELLLRAQKTDK